MDNNLQTDPWSIVEDGFHAGNQLDSETVFSIGNGQVVQRGNLEEYFSGETLQGSYIAGNYYPENGKLSNSNNGYTDKKKIIVNAPNWIGIIVRLNDEKLDLAVWEVLNFKRILNIQHGFLERTFEAISIKGHHIQVSVKRFLSMAEKEAGVISYSVKSLNFVGRISFMPIIDGDLSDYTPAGSDPVWNVLQTKTQQDVAHLWIQTRHTDFHVCTAVTYDLYKNNEHLNIIPTKIEKEKIAGFSTGTDVKTGDTLCLNKYVTILNSTNHPRKELTERACALAKDIKQKGWNKLFEDHADVWADIWNDSEIMVERDIVIQPSGRFELFRKYMELESKG